MRRITMVMILIFCMFALKSVQAVPAEIDESAILGYTKSYTDTFPKKNGETNFNRELGMACIISSD